MASIKTELTLDSSGFEASVNSARDGVDNLGGSVDKIAKSLNDAAAAEAAQNTSLKNLRKAFNEQKAIIQDCVVKMRAMGDAAKDTEGYRKLQQQMQAARESALEMKDSLDAAAESIKDLKVNSNNTDFSGLMNSMKQQTGIDVSSLFGGFGKVGAVMDNVSKMMTSFGDSMGNTGNKATMFGQISNELKANLDALGGAASKLPGIFGKVGSSFASLGTLGKLGWIGAIVGGVMMLGKVMGDAVSKSAEFGESISQLGSITGAEGTALDQMKTQVMNVAKDTATACSDVAKNFALIGSALPELLQNAKGLEEVSRSAITLSKAGIMPLDEATNALTNTMSQFGLSSESAGFAMDVLANGAKYGSAGIKDVSETLRGCGTAASQAGVQLQEAAAAAEVLATKGLKGAEAGTQLKTMFAKMQTKGIDEINPKIVGMSTALKNLKKHAQSAAFMNSTFGESASQAATILANNADKFDELVGKMGDYGTASEMAGKNTDNLRGDIEKLNVTWDNFLSSFNVDSGSFGGFMRDGVQAVTILVEAVDELVHAFDDFAAVSDDNIIDFTPFTDLATTIKLVVDILTELIGYMGSTSNGMNGIASAAAMATAPLKLLNEVLSWISFAVKEIIGWIKAFKESISKLATNIPLFDYMKKMIDTLVNGIKNLLGWYNKLKETVMGGGSTQAKFEVHYETYGLDELLKKKKELEKKKSTTTNVSDIKAINEEIETLDKLIKKRQEAKAQSEIWDKDYAKGSLADLEAQLTALQDQMKKGVLTIDVSEAKKQIKSLEKQIENKKKELGLDSKSKSGSTQTKAKSGSLTDLNNKMTTFQKDIDAGQLQISTEEAYKKIKEFRDQIRTESIKIGKFKAGSLKDLETQLSQAVEDFNKGMLTKVEYDKIAKELSDAIEEKKIQMGIEPTRDSIEGVRKQIEKLTKDLNSGKITLKVDKEAALAQISKLQGDLADKELELDATIRKGSVAKMRKQLEDIKSQLENKIDVGLTVETDDGQIEGFEADIQTLKGLIEGLTFDENGFKDSFDPVIEYIQGKIKDLEEDIKTAEIRLGVSLDLKEAQKQYHDLLTEFSKKHLIDGGGSSFGQAVSEPTATRSQAKKAMENSKPSTFGTTSEQTDAQLEAIKNMMDANDDLIKQLNALQKVFSDMGSAGAEAFDEIGQRIQSVVAEQEKLGEAAKSIKSTNKEQKKWTKNLDKTTSVTSSLADSFSSLGQSLDSPELNIAGIIGGAIANVMAGMAQAMKGPFSSPWEWIAFGVAALAQVIGVVSQIHSLSGHASGGIITGTSAVGDKQLVRVNSGEMIMNNQQQQRLWNIVSGSQSWNYGNQTPNGMVLESRISGRDLVLAIRNNEKSLNKVGKSIGIK